MTASEREAAQKVVGAVIDRWYRLGLLRFNSYDDGSDDLLLRDEIVAALATTPSPDPDRTPDMACGEERLCDHCDSTDGNCR